MAKKSAKKNLDVGLRLQTSDFKKGVKQAVGAIDGLKGSIGDLRDIVAGAAAFMAVGFVADLATDTVEAIASIDLLATRINVSTEALQRFHGALAKKSGFTEIEETADLIKDVTVRVGEMAAGEQGATDEFKKMGLAAEDFIGLNAEEQFFKVAEAIKNIKDETAQTQIVDALFSDAGTKALNLFNSDLKKVTASISENKILTDAQIAASKELDLAIKSGTAAFKSMVVQALTPFIGTMTSVVKVFEDDFLPVLVKVGKFVADHKSEFGTLALAIGGVAAAAAFSTGPIIAMTVALNGAVLAAAKLAINPAFLIAISLAAIGLAAIETQLEEVKAANARGFEAYLGSQFAIFKINAQLLKNIIEETGNIEDAREKLAQGIKIVSEGAAAKAKTSRDDGDEDLAKRIEEQGKKQVQKLQNIFDQKFKVQQAAADQAKTLQDELKAAEIAALDKSIDAAGKEITALANAGKTKSEIYRRQLEEAIFFGVASQEQIDKFTEQIKKLDELKAKAAEGKAAKEDVAAVNATIEGISKEIKALQDADKTKSQIHKEQLDAASKNKNINQEQLDALASQIKILDDLEAKKKEGEEREEAHLKKVADAQKEADRLARVKLGGSLVEVGGFDDQITQLKSVVALAAAAPAAPAAAKADSAIAAIGAGSTDKTSALESIMESVLDQVGELVSSNETIKNILGNSLA